MSLFNRTYTFVDGTIAYGSQVEYEVSNITTTLNNLNTAATNWGQVSILHASNVPLVADCSSGSQDIADFKNNSVTKASIGSGGQLTLKPTSNQIVLGTTNTTTISATAPGSSRVYTIPDVGADASFVMSQGTFAGIGKNRIINGECLFDQINEGSAYTAGGTAHYTLDMWRCEATGTPNFTIQQSTTVPTGFSKSIKFTTNTSGTPGASDAANIEQVVDGPYVRDFKLGTASAVTFTLSFWARASVTGTYSIAFLNEASDRSYVSTYTINSTNTFEFKTITVAGDTTGTWQTAPGHWGMKVVWDTGTGSVATTSTLNSWQSVGVWKASGSISLVANAAATLYFTGVQLEIGSTASAFEYLPYSIALKQVQRYVWKTFPQGTACAAAAGYAGAVGYVVQQPGASAGGVCVSAPIDINPNGSSTITYYNPIVPASATWYNSTASLVSAAPTLTSTLAWTNFLIKNPQLSTDSTGDLMYLHFLVQSQIGGP